MTKDAGDLRVRHGTFQQRLLLTGELKATRAAPVIVPRTPNWQMPIRWMEADGAAVTAGQRVLELDNTQFTGDLEQKRLAESKAVNDLMRKEADLSVELSDKTFAAASARTAREKARIEAGVPVELRALRDHQEKQLELARAEVAYENAVEELRASREASEAALEELRIALETARDEVRTADEAIAALTLYAPRAGILIVETNRREERKYQVGDNVWVGLHVMQIPDLSAMKVEARLSDVDDGKMAPGMLAACTLDTYPDKTYTGSVTVVTRIAKEQGRDSLRRAFDVVVELDEPDPETMRPGMSVRVEVTPPPIEDVLIAPREALDLTADPPRARRANGSWVDIEVGSCNALACIVESGLDEGTRMGARG